MQTDLLEGASRRWLVHGLFVALLAGATYKDAARSATRFHAAAVCLLALGVALFAVGARDRRRVRLRSNLLLLVLILLMGTVLGQYLERLPWDDPGVAVGALFLALAVVPVLAHRRREFLRANAAYVLAAATVLGVYLHHAGSIPLSSGRASFAVYAGVLFVVGLLFVPLHVPRDVFTWAVATLGGALVLVGLPVYLVGEYTLGPLLVRTWSGTVSLAGVSTDVAVLRSTFANPNTLGIATFAGTVAALVASGDAWRTRRRATRPTLLDPFPDRTSTRRRALPVVAGGALLALNGVGLLLSNSRAGLLSAFAGGAVYLAWARDGRRGLALGVGAALGGTALLLAGIATGVLPVSPSHRFELWRGTLVAIERSPSALGRGIVAPSEIIEPYLSGEAAGHSPHNSYLSTFVRTGLVGGLAYLVLTVGNVLDGAVGSATGGRPVAPSALALATGFVVHQLFESYSLYHHEFGAVLATLAFGYLLASRVDGAAAATGTATRARTDARTTWAELDVGNG